VPDVTPELATTNRLDPPAMVRATVVVASAARDGFLRRNRTLATFAVLLAVTDVAVGRFAAVWERHSPDDYAARVTACARERRDLVFVGGSPLAEGIDPERVAGVVRGGRALRSVYAVGLSGATTSDVYHAVLRACPTPPRVLVYGLTATDLNDARHEPHGPHSLMTWGDLAGWVRLRPESAEWVTRHFVLSRVGRVSNLYRYRHGVRMWAACEAEATFPGSSPETFREADELRERADALRTGTGYVPACGIGAGRYDAAKAAGRATADLPFLENYRTGSHLKYLHRLVDWCVAADTELILLDVPVTADLEARYTAAFAEYRGRLAELERDRGVTVLRVAREVAGLTDAEFGDVIHLNRAGAARLSDRVRAELAR
jgi:hypothetical protein